MKIKRFISAVLSASILFASAVPIAFAEGGKSVGAAPTGLVVNELTNPMNSKDVTFGWIVNGSGYNEVQTAYQIVVTDAVNNNEVWNSGKITSSEQSNIKCEGNLDEGHPYKWKVKTWVNDIESDFSAESEFATGISDENWNADWISDGTGGADAAAGSLNHFWYVRGEGSLDNTKEIAKAVGYFAGAQDYDLYINGVEIGRGQTFDYASESRYQGWNITDAVKKNTSKLTAGALVRTYGSGQGRAAVDAGFIGRINVYYADGTSTAITTNSDWKVKTADAYSGTQYRDLGINDSKWSEGDFVENYDAQKAVDFTAEDFDASEWTTATVLNTHNFILYPELSKPTATLVKPVSVTKLSNGTTVADFGTVIPARPSVTFANGIAGTTITIQGGYTLKSDGSINTDQSQTQKTRMTWNYTQKNGAQTYDAWDHLGFRYLSIPFCGENFTVDTIAAKVVHTNVPDGRSSTFVTSNEMLNSVYELMKRSAIYSIQNSFVDTPTREKGQFLQDSINISEASMVTSYERAASKKAIEQFIASADRYWTSDEAGRLNSVYPNGDGKRDIPDFTINFPYWVWNYYMQTGDKEFLAKAYPYVKNTADYITKYINSSTGLVTKLAGGDGNENTYKYGIVDWPNAGRFGYDWSGTKEGARTTVNMLSKRAFDVTALMAAELNNTTDQTTYNQKSTDLKTAINAKLINSNGLYCDGLNSSGNQVSHISQHANSYALAFDIAPADKSEKMSEYIVSQGMKQGPMTADILVKGLINSGENAAALRLLTNTDDYGWAKEAANGYTFTFESWQADSDSNSQSHGWGAAAASDILEGFAGVTVTEPGASKVRIAPIYVDLTSLDASVQTERGAVGVAYERSETDYNITITVPTNMTADIELPNIGGGRFVEKNNHAISENGTAFSVCSGIYEFSYEGDITVLPEALDSTEMDTKEYDFTALSSSEYNAAYTGEYISEDGLLTLKFGTSTSVSEGGNGFDMYNDSAYVKFTPDKTGKISLDVKMRKSSGSNAASTLYMSTTSPNSGGTALQNTVSSDTDITIKDIEVEAGTTYYLYNTSGRPTSIKKISYSYPKAYEITVTPQKSEISINWTFSAEKNTAQSPYDYSDEYADIRLVLNADKGDTVNADGINFKGTGFADKDKGDYDTIGDNGRYILFMPKDSGILNISADFANCGGSTGRVYALPLNAESVDTVDTAALGAIYKDSAGNGQIVAAETSKNPSGAATAESKGIEVEANKVYALVIYSYKNSASIIKSFGYAPENDKPSSLNISSSYTDNMQMYAGRKNKIEGSCFKIGSAEFKLFDKDNNIIQTKTIDLTGKTEWSVLLDAVNDSKNSYTLTITYDGKEYAKLSGITFADLPILKFGSIDYDGETVTFPVTSDAEEVNENVNVYIAEYKDGVLAGIAKTSKTVTESEDITLNYIRKEKNSELKMFIWDDDMKPYCEPKYVYENISSKLAVVPAGETYDSITLAWDKEAGTTYEYEIFQDGESIGTTTNLYYTAENLEPDTDYTFDVKIKATGAAVDDTVYAHTAKKGEIINITDAPYNAKGDSKTVNTAAIQKAIDDCPVNGTVLIPSGTFMSGALDLKSDMTLYLEDDAVLKGTANASDYPMWQSRFEGWELQSHKSLINVGTLDNAGGYNCRNVTIRGKGTIEGGGRALANVTGGVENTTDAQKESTRKRGRLISIHNCQNVHISGISVKQPPAWMIHMVYSDRISTYDVEFTSTRVRNGDGWDPDSSTNCMVFGSTFATGDDCIAIKSGKNPEGNVINKPTKHIRIFNCTSEGGLGLAIGSEMSGGVEDVSVTDCNIQTTRYGLEMKATPKRGGYIRNINVKDCTFDQILMHSVDYNDDGVAAPDKPYFSDMTFENIIVSGYSTYNGTKAVDTPIELVGFDDSEHYVKNIVLKNITVGDKTNINKKIKLKYCDNITFENVLQTNGEAPQYTEESSTNIIKK